MEKWRVEGVKRRRSEWRRDPKREDPPELGAPRNGFVERDEDIVVRR